jgi:hypothetical protein
MAIAEEKNMKSIEKNAKMAQRQPWRTSCGCVRGAAEIRRRQT